jgi:predicted membrane-bound spermidine synthase
MMQKVTIFAPDIAEVEVEPNRLSNHKLIEYYDTGWKRWYE